MQIQINTDKNTEGGENFADEVKIVLVNALDRFAERITRVEVHLSNQSADKRGADEHRCMLEARLEGRKPTAVTHHAATVQDAVAGAAIKLKRTLESTLGRTEDPRR